MIQKNYNIKYTVKDYSGIKVADKNYQCCDCKKNILCGEKYLGHKQMSGIKTRCLNCRQKRLDSL